MTVSTVFLLLLLLPRNTNSLVLHPLSQLLSAGLKRRQRYTYIMMQLSETRRESNVLVSSPQYQAQINKG